MPATSLNTQNLYFTYSAGSRLEWSGTRGITIVADQEAFSVSNTGVPTPSAINLTAQLRGVAGTVTWSVISGTATLDNIYGTTNTLQFANISTKNCKIRVEVTFGGLNYTDEIFITKVTDGSDGAASKSVVISCPTQSFTRADTSSSYLPTSITLTATGSGGTTTAHQWYYHNGTSWATIFGATSSTYTVNSGDFSGSRTFRVQATIDGVQTYDQLTLSQITGGNNAKLISLTASSLVFQINKTNTASPSSITLNAVRNNVTGATFSVETGTATLTSVSGDNATLLYSNMSTDLVKIKVTDGSGLYSDTVTIIKVREGIDAINGYLTNENITLPADNSGVVSSYTGASGYFIVYYGSVDVTAQCTFAVQTNASGLTPTNSIVTAGVNAGQYAITGGMNSVDNAVVVYRATYVNAFGTTFTIDKAFTISKSKTGSVGSTGAAARIAYVKTTGTLSPTPSITTVSGDSLPITGTWGESNAWQLYPPTIGAGEQVWQTTGTYNYITNQTTWVAPYLSNLKVGTLSALTVNTGTLTVDASGYIRGGQTAYNTGTGFWLGYDSGAYKFSIGSSTQGITWDGSALNITGKLQIGTAGISAGVMTGTGAQINVDGTFALGTSNITTGTGGNGYDATGASITYNGTDMVVNGIIKTSGLKGISFKTAGSVSSNLGNIVRVAGTESMLQVSRYATTSLPAMYIYDGSTAGSTESLYVTNTSSFAGTTLVSFHSNKGNALYLSSTDTTYPTLEVTNPTTTSVKGTAFFKNTATGTEVALGGGYPVYVAPTKGKIYSTDGYLPFTGSHEALLSKTVDVKIGDIVCVKDLVFKKDINNIITEVELSQQSLQKTRFGVLCYTTDIGEEVGLPPYLHTTYGKSHYLAVVNGLGEGQINVCGESGDIEIGDLIVTSNYAGKGMKGEDTTPINRVVAQAIENVKFASKDEVKMIGCIYLCS